MSAKKAKNENKIGLVFKIFDKDYSKNDMVKKNIMVIMIEKRWKGSIKRIVVKRTETINDKVH